MRFKHFFLLYVLALIPHSIEIPWVYITCSALIALHAYAALSGFMKTLSRFMIGALSVLSVTYVFYDYKTLIGPEPATSLLVVLSALKLQEIRAKRDGIIYLFLIALVVMYYLLFTQTIFSTLYMIMMCMALALGFIALNTPREHLPSILKSSPRLVAKDLLISLPVFLVMFLFFPRFSTPWASFINDDKVSVGFSDNLKPGEMASLAQSKEIAFHVLFENNKIPPLSHLYWRGVVLDIAEGWLWSTKTKPLRSFDLNPSRSNRPSDIYYKVQIEPRFHKYLFSLESTTSLKWSEKDMYNPFRKYDSRTFSSEYSVVTRLQYEGQASLDSNYVEPLTAEQRASLLQMTPPSKRMQQFIDAIKSQATENNQTSALDYANFLNNYFSSNGFQYSLNTPQMNSIDDFMFDKKVGFCEHYATTFSTIMRWLGVPSRVVSGFQGGEINDFANFVLVRDQNAHSWSEIHDGRQWVRIDPTSAVNSMRISLGSLEGALPNEFSGANGRLSQLYNQAQMAFSALELKYNQFLLNYNFEAQLDLLGLESDNLRIKRWLYFLISMFGVAVLYFTIKLIFKNKIRSDALKTAYDQALELFKAQGLKIEVYHGPRTVFQMAIQKWPQHTSKLSEIERIYVDSRYGSQQPLNHKKTAAFIKSKIKDIEFN